MNELTRSIPAMLMASVAAALWALSSVLAGVAYATFSGPQDVGTFQDLGTASEWVLFAAGLMVLIAIAFVGWSLFVDRRWSVTWEIAGAAVSTLLIVIGLLLVAANGLQASQAGNVVSAIGLGGWAIVVVVGAARHALNEAEVPGTPRQATLRLGAAASLIIVAVSFGLPEPSFSQVSLAIADAVLVAVGTAGLVVVLSISKSKGFIKTRYFTALALGLWILVLSGVARAVAGGLVYGTPPPSFLTYRISLSIPAFLTAVAALVLGWAAFARTSELRPPLPLQPTTAAEPGIPQPDTSTRVPSSWQSDPTHRNELRWWDGVQWTDHVLNGGTPSTDQLPRPDD